MTTTGLSALYILYCLLMAGVTAKVILMACKPVSWSEIKMISYPVHYDEELGGIYDKSCHFICDVSSKTNGNEIVKRINMHDELMRVLCDIQQMCIGDIAMGYKLEAETIGQLISEATGLTAPELMEQCK